MAAPQAHEPSSSDDPTHVWCWYYRFLTPLDGEFVDKVRVHAHRRFVDVDKKRYTLNLGGTKNAIQFARMDFPVQTDGSLDEHDPDVLQACFEHLLSILRTTYEREVAFWGMPVWIFGNPNDREFGLRISAKQLINEDFEVDYENALGMFVAGLDHRVRLKHLSDSVNPGIPLRFRYLAAYQVLEEEFRTGDNLDGKALDAFLEAQGSGMTRAKLIGLRDRCAHVRVKGRQQKGLIELSNKDATALHEALPEVQGLAGAILNRLLAGQATLYQRRRVDDRSAPKTSLDDT